MTGSLSPGQSRVWPPGGKRSNGVSTGENVFSRTAHGIPGVQSPPNQREYLHGSERDAEPGESVPLHTVTTEQSRISTAVPSRPAFTALGPSYSSSQPLLDDDLMSMIPAKNNQSQKPPEWRKALYWATGLAAIVLVFNTIWAVVAVTKYPLDHGLRRLYQGNCTTASRIDSVLHVVINILSTLLLGASNYVMQILNSPTRDECDRAHRRGKWLSIGLTNVKNLAYIPIRRAILFTLLFTTAWPLHLIWNSIVFSSNQANIYSALIVTSDFISSDTFDSNLGNLESSGGFTEFKGFNLTSSKAPRRNITVASPEGGGAFAGADVKNEFNTSSFLSFAENLYQKSKTTNSMAYLDAATCIREYSADFLAKQRNLLVVVNSSTDLPPGQVAGNGSMLALLDSRNWNQDLSSNGGAHWNPSAWMCSSIRDPAAIIINEGSIDSNNGTKFSPSGGIDLTCDISKVLDYEKRYQNWTVASQVQSHTYAVDHCLSEIAPEVCEVQFALSLMIVVLACNAIKLFCMIMAIKAFPKQPLVVLGDAVASFLNTRDPMTAGLCLIVGPNAERHDPQGGTEIQKAKTRNWSDKPKLWSDVARGNWMMALTIALAAVGFGIAMLYRGSSHLGVQSFSSLSFGAVNPSTLILNYAASEDVTSQSQLFLLRMVLVANSPQIVFSMLYFLYNRSYTAMCGMVEWTTFAIKRQSLRVSRPTGIQRSTYWLQLPYLYSLPLLIGSGLTHWVLSQSLFLVRVSFYDRYGQPTVPGLSAEITPTSNTITIPGFSPKAILAAIIISVIMVVVLVGNEFRRYPSPMPLVVNSSFAISAACHQSENDPDAAYQRVMWGAVSHPDGDLPGHCCFTSHEVEMPIVGEHYE